MGLGTVIVLDIEVDLVEEGLSSLSHLGRFLRMLGIQKYFLGRLEENLLFDSHCLAIKSFRKQICPSAVLVSLYVKGSWFLRQSCHELLVI